MKEALERNNNNEGAGFEAAIDMLENDLREVEGVLEVLPSLPKAQQEFIWAKTTSILERAPVVLSNALGGAIPGIMERIHDPRDMRWAVLQDTLAKVPELVEKIQGLFQRAERVEQEMEEVN
jgi:hypothetical protein